MRMGTGRSMWQLNVELEMRASSKNMNILSFCLRCGVQKPCWLIMVDDVLAISGVIQYVGDHQDPLCEMLWTNQCSQILSGSNQDKEKPRTMASWQRVFSKRQVLPLGHLRIQGLPNIKKHYSRTIKQSTVSRYVKKCQVHLVNLCLQMDEIQLAQMQWWGPETRVGPNQLDCRLQVW